MLEAARDLIARHAQAENQDLTDEIVALYTQDCVLVVPGLGSYSGAEAVGRAFDEWRPQHPNQRNVVVNTHLLSWIDDVAVTGSDAIFLRLQDGRWSVLTVARYTDTFQRLDDVWRISRREAEFVF